MIFNNREFAVLIWSLLAFFLILVVPKFRDVRSSLMLVLRSLFQRQVIGAVTLLFIYTCLIVWGMYLIDIWHFSQLKNTVIWFFAVGIYTLFQLEKIERDEFFYKKFVMENFQLLAIIQFFVGFYSFPLIVELIFIILLLLLSMMVAISNNKPEYKSINRFFNISLSMIGLSVLSYSIFMAFQDFDSFANYSTFEDFYTPSLLTISFLPLAYFFTIYAAYQRVFTRLKFSIPDDNLREFTQWYVYASFRLRFRLLKRWNKHLAWKSLSTRAEVMASVQDIFDLVEKEKQAKFTVVSPEKGWNPYDAMKFLQSQRLEATDYHHTNDISEWFAVSEFFNLPGIERLDNHVHFTVSGNADAATNLDLFLNISDPDSSLIAHIQLLNLARVLLSHALDQDMDEQMEQQIISGEDFKRRFGKFVVEYKLHRWMNSAIPRHDLQFVIHVL